LERDLFDAEHEGCLADPAMLDRLVAERCETLVADLHAQGWAWAKPYLDSDYWEVLQKYDRLQPVPVELDENLLTEADKLRSELDSIDQQFDGEHSEECERRIDEIQTRLDQINFGSKRIHRRAEKPKRGDHHDRFRLGDYADCLYEIGISFFSNPRSRGARSY
jgi:hypothetical protein